MGYAYGFFWRCRAIDDIAHLTSYRDVIGVPCIRALAGRLQLGLIVYYCDTSLLCVCVWRQCHDKSCMTSAIEMSDICMQANAASGLSGPVGGNMSCVLGCRWQDMVTLRGI